MGNTYIKGQKRTKNLWMRQGKCLQSLQRESMTYWGLEVRLKDRYGQEREITKTSIKKFGEKRRKKKGRRKGRPKSS